MAFIPTEDGARAIFEYSIGGDLIASNHLWFSKPDFTALDMESLAGAVAALGFANNGMKDFIHQSVDFSVRVIDERTYQGTIYRLSDPDWDGEDVTEFYSKNDAMVLTLYTSKRGRAYRGRLYLWGFCEDGLDNGGYSATCQLSVTTSIAEMQSTALAAGWVWCVRTSQVDKVPLNPCTLTPITNYQIRSALPGTQVRRTRRP